VEDSNFGKGDSIIKKCPAYITCTPGTNIAPIFTTSIEEVTIFLGKIKVLTPVISDENEYDSITCALESEIFPWLVLEANSCVITLDTTLSDESVYGDYEVIISAKDNNSVLDPSGELSTVLKLTVSIVAENEYNNPPMFEAIPQTY